MNIKFSTQSISFKISEDELSLLTSQNPLRESLSILGDIFLFEIVPIESGDVSLKTMSPFGLSLIFPQQMIHDLFNMGKNRDGLCIDKNDLKIYVQVDVRSDTRKRNSL